MRELIERGREFIKSRRVFS